MFNESFGGKWIDGDRPNKIAGQQNYPPGIPLESQSSLLFLPWMTAPLYEEVLP
jgi:hypothetical protein